MEAEPEAFIFKFNPKHDSQQVLQILKALKQASHHLQKNPNSEQTDSNTTISTLSAIKALLELEHESESILCNDPHLIPLSTHLTALKTLVNNSRNVHQRHRGLRSFITRRVNSHEISKLASSIEIEIQAWIDREFIKTLTQMLHTGSEATETNQSILIDLIQQFEQRIASGFDRKLQDSILRSRVFTNLESILSDRRFSKNVREASAFAISELIRFNKDVFVGQVLISNTLCALISLASELSSVQSIKILCRLIRSIKSPIVDEIVSNGKIPKLISLLSYDEISIRAMAMNCVFEIGYFGRKEAVDAMLDEDVVKKLVELQMFESERCVFERCVARFAVQLEVGEGLRGREKREVKQVVLQRVREAHVCDAEAATIVAEVLWGASP